MDMKMKQIHVSMVIVVMSTLVVSSAGRRRIWWTTPGYPEENLTKKMFTLSRNGGRISFFPPSFSLRPPVTMPVTPTKETGYDATTHGRYTTTHGYYPTTHGHYPTNHTRHTTTHRQHTTYPWPTPTASSRGVSVCLRFLTDSYLSENFPLFTLSPSRSPLQVDVGISGLFRLSFDSWGRSTIFLRPNVRFWSNMWPNIWTSVCITVDPLKNVAQLFSGSYMSIRKLIPGQYMWSGEPVVYFSGFDGQMTDLQVWDYPLQYREIYSYMQSYGYQGSVLTWSRIGYRPQGNALLEDTFELQGKQPIGKQGRGQRVKASRRIGKKRQQL